MKMTVYRSDVIALRKPVNPGTRFWKLALLHDLGYAFPSDIDTELPLSEYKVAVGRNSVRVIGRFVLIREVVMDADGNCLSTRGGKQKTRTVIRRLP